MVCCGVLWCAVVCCGVVWRDLVTAWDRVYSSLFVSLCSSACSQYEMGSLIGFARRY